MGFFQTIRVVLNKKTAAKTGKTPAQLDAAIQQIVSRAIVSTEIIDVMAAAGIGSPDISILSDDFLAEIRNMDRKNLALEALRRLINDEIRAPERKNVVEIRSFSQRLEDAIKRYHNNALTTAQVIEQLIELAKEIQEARQRGDDDELSVEERAFYSALANNQSAVDVMGNEQLRITAAELLNHLKRNISVDWTERQAARAKLRVLVKRILQNAAVQTVIQQAELYAAEWAKEAA